MKLFDKLLRWDELRVRLKAAEEAGIELAKENGVTGSRIMGGGFGGCTINLVRNDLYRKFVEDAKQKFNAKYGHEPKVYDVVIGDGARKLC